MMLLIVISNRKIRRNIDFLICIYDSEKDKVKKRAFVFFPILMIMVFSWRLYRGFIYPGICGWTEEHTSLNCIQVESSKEIVLLPDSLYMMLLMQRVYAIWRKTFMLTVQGCSFISKMGLLRLQIKKY
jgi:hypothetical protein